MKKIYSLFATVVMVASLSAQAFTATYDFAGAPPNLNGVVVGTNITASAFSNSGITQTTTGERYANTGTATTTTPDTSKYMQVTVTPASGYKVDVTSITFRSQRSGTGPRNYVVRSSVDNYATNLPASISPANAELSVVGTNEFYFVNDISTGQNGNVVTPVMDAQAGPVTYRFYFYNAEASTGTFSVDDVVISGAVEVNLATSDINAAKVKLVKNSNVHSTIIFGAKANVQILNSNGQVVRTAAVSENSALDVSSLAKGMYIVTADLNGQKVSQKVIKN